MLLPRKYSNFQAMLKVKFANHTLESLFSAIDVQSQTLPTVIGFCIDRFFLKAGLLLSSWNHEFCSQYCSTDINKDKKMRKMSWPTDDTQFIFWRKIKLKLFSESKRTPAKSKMFGNLRRKKRTSLLKGSPIRSLWMKDRHQRTRKDIFRIINNREQAEKKCEPLGQTPTMQSKHWQNGLPMAVSCWYAASCRTTSEIFSILNIS